MTEPTGALPVDVDSRLNRLERENVRLKYAMVGLIVIFAIVTFATRTRDFSRVKAHEFDLTDSNGRIRGRLAILPEGPGLELRAASGEKRVVLVGGGEDANLDLYLPITSSTTSAAAVNLFQGAKLIASLRGGPSVSRIDLSSGKAAAALVVRPKMASMGLDGNPSEGSGLVFEASPTTSCVAARKDDESTTVDHPKNFDGMADGTKGTASASMCLSSQGEPTIALEGRRGARAVLGVASSLQQKGHAWGNSAASLVLMKKKGHVLWSTPR